MSVSVARHRAAQEGRLRAPGPGSRRALDSSARPSATTG